MNSDSARALEGLRIMDMSRILAGPYCTQILGDLGAQVTKIERPGDGDDTRSWGPPFFEDTSAYFLSANRNKESLFLDFKNPADREQLVQLIRQADILVENFKTGDLARYQLDYESLKEINPRLIYCTISGFGSTGPYSKKPGYDALIQAMGGLMSITGPQQGPSTKVGVAIADITAGLYATVGILAAVNERHQSGLGQHIEISLFDTQVSWLANVAMNFLVTGKTPTSLGNHHPSIVPYGTYTCRDGDLMLAVGNDEQFRRLTQVLGEGGWCHPRFATNKERVENRLELEPLLNGKFKTETRDFWLKAIEPEGIPVGPVNTMDDLLKDPHQQARSLFTTMDDGKTPCLRSPLILSRTPITSYKPPTKL